MCMTIRSWRGSDRRARHAVPLRFSRFSPGRDGAQHAAPLQMRRACYKTVARATRAPVLMPKPLPPRTRPFGRVPLPVDGSGVGPAVPPPITAVGGEPKLTGAEGVEPMYCE